MAKEKKWRATIKRTLENRQLSQREFCKRMKLTHSEFSDILSGKKKMNTRYAVALEFMCIGKAELWMKYQLEESIKEEKEKLGF